MTTTEITDARLAEMVGAGVPCVPAQPGEIAAVVQELRQARKALSPFANVPLIDQTPDAPRGMWVSVPFGWLQDARAALHPEQEQSDED